MRSTENSPLLFSAFHATRSLDFTDAFEARDVEPFLSPEMRHIRNGSCYNYDST